MPGSSLPPCCCLLAHFGAPPDPPALSCSLSPLLPPLPVPTHLSLHCCPVPPLYRLGPPPSHLRPASVPPRTASVLQVEKEAADAARQMGQQLQTRLELAERTAAEAAQQLAALRVGQGQRAAVLLPWALRMP